VSNPIPIIHPTMIDASFCLPGKTETIENYEQGRSSLEETILRLTRTNDELVAEKSMYQATLACMGDAVIITDREMNITFLNRVAEDLSGWGRSAAIGLNLAVVFNAIEDETGKAAEDSVTKCLNTRERVRPSGDRLLIRRDGHRLSIDETAAPILNTAGEIAGAVLSFRDISATRRLVQQLSHDAFHDALTGLENRRGFEHSLRRILVTLDRKPNALLYLDLDQFKVVNDTGGHAAGDILLHEIAALLRTYVRSGDRVARLGGDEFGIILEDCTKLDARRVANELRLAIAGFRFCWDNVVFALSVSIGVVAIDQARGSVSSLLIAADDACYAAKDGGNRVRVYEPDDRLLLARRGEMRWVGRINDALRNDQFCLYHQPIVSLNAAPGAAEWNEILVRLIDDNGELVLPGQFMPAAERYGLITAIDRWVFQRGLAIIQTRKPSLSRVMYSINISGKSLSDETFLAFLVEEARESKVNLRQVCIEITETAAIGNLALAVKFISVLKAQGCLFALDDFGTGTSSFAYLQGLSVDYIKIAGRFVQNMVSDRLDRAMVAGIHDISRTIGIEAIAEAVEDEGTLASLKSLGIEYAQGFLLGRPTVFQTHASGDLSI
jgi:diguanylate cyclase (GGDEF)-like protein/PAS domain S-box-containing protein